MQIEEYVPTTTPISSANANPCNEPVPKTRMANRTTMIVIDVLNVLDNVLFKALLTTKLIPWDLPPPLTLSLTLSNTTTVSLIE